LTTITNSHPVIVSTMTEVQSWMTSNSISTTGSTSLAIDQFGYVEEFITAETLSGSQITDFKETFFHKRSHGSKGADVASAGTITLTEGNYFDITGTSTINYITTTTWKEGTKITLQFDSAVTINHNTATPPANTEALFLNGSSNFSATAGSTLSVVYDGGYWREISRMTA